MQLIASFGRILKERRRTLDMTQEHLARQVGCALVTIKKIEADALRPSKQIAELLAEALDILADERAAFVRLARSTPRTPKSPVPQNPFLTEENPERSDLSGHVIKGYELRERIGVGGFGVVYRAEQMGVGRPVAIKIILPQYANHPEFIRRFESEAQIVARLEHPHIVPLYDYWRDPGGAYLVMRYIRGGSLQSALQGAPWQLDRVTRLLEQIGAALTFAHQLGVVHRDVKPANILLDEDGNAYLADFGIAKELSQATPTDQTTDNAIVGSPAYLSPEQIRDESVTPQTDIYSLGIMLYELLTGSPPFTKLTPGELIQKQLSEPLPQLAAHRPDLPARLNDVIQRATAKRPHERYADVHSLTLAVRHELAIGNAATGDPAAVIQANMCTLSTSEYADVDAACTTSDQETALLSALLDADMLPLENPYKGLRAFSEPDAGDFFGRDTLVGRLLERMAGSATEDIENTEKRMHIDASSGDSMLAVARNRFLAVVGPSGSGKSSVVKAGLIPAIRRGGLPGSEQWFVVDVLPGAHPLEEIEAALLRVAVNPPISLLAQLQEDERGLLRTVKRVLPADDAIELVLVIDQFEELFTLVEDETARLLLLNSLHTAITDPRSRMWLIVTLRADFYDRPLLYPGFSELIRMRTEVVTPLTPQELEQAIVGPAERAGLRLEPGLVTATVKDVGEHPGALPLLQYALAELFERREGRTLTLAAYHRSGGVSGALARRADELYDTLDQAGKQAARQLFLRLVTLGEGVEDTRRRVRRAELAGDSAVMDRIIDLYVRYRLLTFDRDPITRGPTLEIAHEALIRAWGRLRAWLDANRDDLRAQRRLASETAAWVSADRDPSFLATGARLARYAALDETTAVVLNAEERAYLEASAAEQSRQEAVEREHQERELGLAQKTATAQQSAAKRLRYLVGALVLFLVIAAVLTTYAFSQRSDAVANLTRSEAQRLAAEANKLLQARGNAEVIALLAIRSIHTQYSPQGDAALIGAATLDYAERILHGHTATIRSVSFSPDGQYLLTSSDDKTARLWDARTGAEIRQFVGHTAEVWDSVFSSDGNYVLTGSRDMTARLWNAHTGQELRVFAGHTMGINSVAISPDGQYALTGSDDKSARLWEMQTGRAIRDFIGHDDLIWAVAFSPDGHSVLTGSADKTARMWDTQTGAHLRTFTGHTDFVWNVAFSPDGKSILTGSPDKTARLWDVQTGRELRRFVGHTNFINGVAFSPDGRMVLTGSQDRTARLWDVQTGAELRRLNGHTSLLWDVAYSPDGNYILTGSFDGTAKLWNLQAKNGLPQFVGHTAAVRSVAFSRDGSTILTSSDDSMARLWNAKTGQTVRTFSGHSQALSAAAFSPDGRYILTGSSDRTARLWDASTGQQVQVLSGHTDIGLTSVAFSPDGMQALTGGYDATARLYDLQSGATLHIFRHDSNVYNVAFSPDGKYILTGAYDKTARLWDSKTYTQLHMFRDPTGAGSASVAFSPDSQYVLTGSWDGNVRLWNIQTGTEIRRFAGHSDAVWSMSFSSDGHYALSGSGDGTARLWDVQTGVELRRFSSDGSAVNGVAFSPDGKHVLTGSADGTARLWDIDYHDTIRYLCGRLLRDFTDDERAQYGIPNDEPTCPNA
jgi:WD40 repeat protein/serine/threonine protein kinase/DNA-binding XRE family transcriptional regulator